jgi:hypothetical protein
MTIPTQLSINAWTGTEGGATGETGEDAVRWGVKQHMQEALRFLVAPDAVPLYQWQHEQIGWGLVLPENENISPADRALAKDAPEPIRELLAARPGSPVFRYSPDLQNRHLRRGIGAGQLPYYLLIVGSPAEIPWSLQYALNQPCFVGRLDLDETGLERYVNALLTEWADADSRPDQPVVWTVDHGHPDITWLMRHAIAEPVGLKFTQDSDIGDKATILAGAAATVSGLTSALATKKPGLIVTTSHGMTGPLNNLELMAQQMGLLVDDVGATLQPDALLQQWQPDGAIWYAHACCSAGSDNTTSYKGLLTPGSPADQVLEAVAQSGARVAPLPKALLGAEKPLRAFIGQVEPTFDWTIRDPDTGQVLTRTIRDALYSRMYRKINSADQAEREAARIAALRSQLTALDWQSMVILGDPTACIPALHPEGHDG